MRSYMLTSDSDIASLGGTTTSMAVETKSSSNGFVFSVVVKSIPWDPLVNGGFKNHGLAPTHVDLM